MLEFYGLREHPFGVSPNPRFLYPSVQHREAMASLIFGIENQVGFAALIAEPGAGKTTLLFEILQRYRERANTAFVFNTQSCSGQDLIRQVVVELQIPSGDSERDPVKLYQYFTTFVAAQRTSPVLIIIDEAQNLENSALETLRLLSNFEAPDRKLLHIVLAGQPQLGVKLRSPSLTQLLQRITTISRLERFSPAQTQECIEFRLRVAGCTGAPPFTNEALAKIKDASGGVPREINRICINALQLGFALRQKKIAVEVIDEVLADLFLTEEPLGEASEPQSDGVETKVSSSSPSPQPKVSPAKPPVFRLDEPWQSHTPVDTMSLGFLPPRDEVGKVAGKASAETKDQQQPVVQAPVPAPEAPLPPPARFQYTFAMGCVPRPARASRDVQTAPPGPAEPARTAAQQARPGGADNGDGAVPGRREAAHVAGRAAIAQGAVPSTLGK